MVTSAKISLDEVLCNIGLGWFHFRLWWICGFGFSAAAVEVVLMSFVFPELQLAPWRLDEYQLGTIATIMGSGSIFGTTICGGLADKYGRRNVFMTTVIIVVVFGLASALSQSYYALAALRFCVGFGYGGNIAVDFTLYSEFLPTNGRGSMLFLLTGFWPLGQMFTCLIAWVLIPAHGWKVFVAACTIPSMITAFARPLIPESPRWLLLQGQKDAATVVCCQMAELNGKSPAEVGLEDGTELVLSNENTSLESEARDVEMDFMSCSILQRLFGPNLWRTSLGLLIIVSALNYTGYGTLTLMPRFLRDKGISQPNMYRSMLLNAASQLPGVGFATCAATYIGRLLPLRVSVFITGLSLFFFALATEATHITVCTMFASCFLEAAWSLYHVYVPEVFPTECRARATGFLSAAGSLVSIAGPLASAALLTKESKMTVIMVFASVATLAGVSSVVLLHIETKDRDLSDVASEALGGKNEKALRLDAEKTS